MSEEAVALGGGNVGGGIAGQVRAHVADLKDGTPAKVALAASQLRVLVGDSAGKVACVQNGGLEPLVDLVKNCDVDGTGVGDAAGAIASLSTLQSGKRLTGIAKEVLVEPMVALLATGSSRGKSNAISALWHFAVMGDEVESRVLASGAVAEVFVQLKKDTLASDEATQDAVGLLWALAANAAGRRVLFEADPIATLLHVLQNGTEAAAEASAGILRLCAGDGDAQRAALMESSAVEVFTAAANHRAAAVREQASAALRALWSPAASTTATSASDGVSNAASAVGAQMSSSDVGGQVHTAMGNVGSMTHTAALETTRNHGGNAVAHPSSTAMVGGGGGGDVASFQSSQSHLPAFSELKDVMPLVELLSTTTSNAEIETLVAALASMACDHQMALLEAGAVVPLIRLLDRAGHEATILGEGANGVGVADAAGIILSLWRWGRPQERIQLERMIMGVVDGMVKLLVAGSSIGREQAVGALCAMAATSDGVKLAIAEAGAVKPLIRLIRSSTKTDNNVNTVADDSQVSNSWGSGVTEEAEGVLWSLLALNREKSHDTRVSAEAAADLVHLLQTTPAMAREAAGVLRSLASNAKNRVALLQAGAVDGLIRVLATAGSRCTGDGVAIAEAAGAMAMLAANDGHIGAMANDTIDGLVALLERGSVQGKVQATNALWSLATISERTKLAIIDTGAVNLLIDVLGSPGTTREHDETTAGVLWALLSLNNKRSKGYWARYAEGTGETKGDVRVSVSAIQGLVPLLNTGSDVMREAAAGIFALVAPSDYNKVCICKAGAIEPLVDLLVNTEHEGMRESVASALRIMPDYDDDQHVITSSKKAVDALIALLADPVSSDPRLAALLEQLCYDTCHAFLTGETPLALSDVFVRDGVAQSRDDLLTMHERGVEHWKGGMPLVDTLANGSPQLIENARAGLCCLSAASKTNLIKSGMLSALVEVCGATTAEACLVVLKQACASLDGAGALECGAALAKICQVDDPSGAVADALPQALDWVMPLLETGTDDGRAEAAGTLRCLASATEEMKVQMIRSGMFGPLVRLMNSGTLRAKEESAGALYELLLLMNECNIAVNVTQQAAEDVRFLLRNGSPTGLIKQKLPCVSTDRCERQMYAAGVARLCATSSTNKEIIVAAATVEPLVGVLLAAPLARGVHTKEQAAQEAAGALLRLAEYGDEATSQPSSLLIPEEAEASPVPDADGGSWFSGMFEGSSKQISLAKSASTQQKKTPRSEVERLCKLLLQADSDGVDNGQHAALGALLVRLVSDIFAFAPKPQKRASGEEFQSSAAEVHNSSFADVQALPNSVTRVNQATHESTALTTSAAAAASFDGEASEQGVSRHDGEQSSVVSSAAAVNKIAVVDSPLLPSANFVVPDEVRPLVQMLENGSPEVKQQAKAAIESLNVQTQMALIHAGALKPLLELLGPSTAPALVQFCSSAAANHAGHHVAAAGRALSQIIIAQSDIEGITDLSMVAVAGLTQLLALGSPEGKSEAASALWSLSLAHEAFKTSIIQSGAIEPMVSLLGASSTSGREEAAGVLWAILTSQSDPSIASVNVEITHADAINIVGILNDCGELGQEAAAGVISLVVTNDRNKACLFLAQCVEPLVGLLYSASDGVRSQAASALRSLCIYQPDVYKSGGRSDLVQGAAEVKKLIQFQLAPSMASPQHAALIEQLVYDIYDVVVRAGAQESKGDAASQNGVTSVNYASRDLSPAHRINNTRRASVLREMLEHASDEQKTQVRPAFLCLSAEVLTKQQLIDSGCLHLLVSFLGVHTARALVVATASACQSDTGKQCASYCSALAGLASPQEQSVNGMIIRIIPHVVNLLVNGSETGKEEAAGGLRALSVTSFNAKVAIAEAGAFAPLVKLLGEGTQTAREESAGALWRLLTMMTESNIAISISVKKAADLVSLLHASSDSGKLSACGCIRLAATTTDENRCAIIRARVVEPLVALLGSPSGDIREEAGGALRALASPGMEITDSSRQARMTRASQAVDTLVSVLAERVHANDQLSALLEYLQYDIFEMRLEHKYNPAGDGQQSRLPNLESEYETFDKGMPIEQIHEQERLASSQAGNQALTKLRTRGRQLGGSREAASGIVPVIQLLQSGTERTHAYAKGALSSLGVHTKAAIIESGALHQLVAVIGVHASKAIVHMLQHVVESADGAGSGAGTSASDLAAELAAAFATISASDERMGRIAEGASAVVPGLVRLLETGSATGQEQAAGALRQLSGLHDNLTVAIAREGAFEPLVKLLGVGTSAAREESAGALWRILEVTLSPARATDLVSMLTQSSIFGQERAAGVLALCATSDVNRASIMHAHAVEPLIHLLVHASQAVREPVAAALVNLAITDGDVDQAYRGWLDSASVEVTRLVSFIKHGGCSGGFDEENVDPSPLSRGGNAMVSQGDSGDISAADTVKLQQGLAVSSVPSDDAGDDAYANSQLGAVVEQLIYDCFYMRYASGLLSKFGFLHSSDGKNLHPRDVYAHIADERHLAFVRRLILRLLYNGDAEAQGQARASIFAFSVATKVAFIEDGALRPLAELLGTNICDTAIAYLAQAHERTDGNNVAEVAAQLRLVASDSPDVSSRIASGIAGVVSLLETGVAPGGKEAAINALWSLSMIDLEIKAEIVRAGALSVAVEMLYGGRSQFRSDVTVNAEPIVDAGACPGLVQMLHVGDEAGQEAAAGCLRLCATHDSNKPFIISARAVEPLVGMLNLWSEAICEQAAGALLALSRYSGSNGYLEAAGDEVQSLVELRMVQARLERTVSLPTDSGKQHLSALLERLVLDIYEEQSASNPLIVGVTKRKTGGPPMNVSRIYGGDNNGGDKQMIAASDSAGGGTSQQLDISKLSIHSSEDDDAKVSLDADKDRGFPYIVQLLTQCSADVREHASGAIRALSVRTKAALVEAGCLAELCSMLGNGMGPVLVHLLASPRVSSVNISEYSAALAEIAALDAGVAMESEAVVLQLVNILESGASATEREQAAAGLRHLADSSTTLRYAIVREGGFGPLVKLLGSGSTTGKEEAASTLWQLVSLMNESNVEVTLSPGSAADIVSLARGVGVSVRGRESACAVMEQCCADRTSQSNRETLVSAGAIEAAAAVVGASDLPPGPRQQGVRALLGLTGHNDQTDSSEAWLQQVRHQISYVGSMISEGGVEREWGAEALRHCEALVEQLAYDACSVLQSVSASKPQTPGAISLPSVDADALDGGNEANPMVMYESSKPPPVKLGLLDCGRIDEDVNADRASQRVSLLATCLHSPTEGDARSALQGAFAALSTPTKEALICGGALRPLAALIGSSVGEGVCEAVLRQMARAAATPDGERCAELAGAVHALAAIDPSVEDRACCAVAALVPLLRHGSVHGREQGVSALWTLSTIGETLKSSIAGAGAMDPLVNLATNGSSSAKESAAGCLWALTVSNDALKRAAHAALAVEPLIQLLFSGTQAAKEEACGALWSIAMVPEFTLHITSGGAAPGCMQLLYTGSEVGQESAAGLLHLCASQDENKPAIVSAKVIEPLVALCQEGSEAAKGQAACALKALVIFQVSVPRQLLQSASEVERLTAILATASGKQKHSRVVTGAPCQLVLAVSAASISDADAFGLRGTVAGNVKHPLAHVLEQVVYDVHDMFAAAALGGEIGFGLARGPTGSAGNLVAANSEDKWYNASAREHHDVRPLVEMLNDGAEELLRAAEGAVHCFSVNTKVAIIESGGLVALVNLLGAGAARAIVHVLCTAPSIPDGPRVTDLMNALCRIGSADGRVAAMALDTTPALLELLQADAAGKEQAAGALWNLRMLNATVDQQLMAAGAVELLVQTLGMGTAASHATPTSLARLWHLLCLPDDTSDVVGEQSATDVVQLLYTGTDAGKEAAARCVRLCGIVDENRAAFMRARCVEPLVEGLQMAPPHIKREMSGALLALGERHNSSRAKAANEQPESDSWLGSFFGGGGASAGGRGGGKGGPQDEEAAAVQTAEAEIRELIGLLFDVDANFGDGSAIGLSGGFHKQRKAAARLEQLMYYVFHAKSCYIVM